MALDIGIKLNLEGYEGVMRDLQKLDSYVKDHNKEEIAISFDKAKREVMAYRAEVKRLKSELDEIGKGNDGWDEKNAELKEAKANLNQATTAASELAYAMAKVKKQMSFGQAFKKFSTDAAHLGSALQSAGNALTRLGSPFKRLTSGFVMGAGYKMLNQVTEGVNSAFSRADTMRKYTKLMAEYSKENYTAEDSVKALDKAVTGLPIALDDAVSLAQRYTLSLGDMERGTNLAIATENAFLASMATESQRYQGMMQMQDLLNGKDLNSREWMSLGASMGKAINEIGKELGYTNDNMGEFRQQLYGGKVSTEDFLDALEKVGTGNGSLVKLAQESMDTWEAFFSRIKTAFSRFGYGIISSLDELVTTVTKGEFKSLNSFLDDMIIPSIDDMTKSVKEWIKAHPDEIVDFFKQFKDIDFKGLIQGFAEASLAMAKMAGGFVKFFGNIFGGKWGGRIMAVLSPLGSLLTVTGGLLKGTRHIWGLLGAGLFTALRKTGKGGIIGKIMELFGGKNIVDSVGEAKAIPTVAETFKSAFSALQGLIKAAGAITLVAGTGFVAFKAVKSILSDLKDMVDLVNGGGWDNVGFVASGVIVGIGAFTEIFQAIGTALGPQGLLSVAIASAASFLVAGSFAADMWAIKQGVIQIRDTIAELDNVATAITNFKGIGTLDEGVKNKVRNTIEAINEIKNMFVGKNGSIKDRGQIETGLPTFSVGKVSALTNMSNALEQMQKIAAQLNTLADVTVKDPSDTISKIRDACNKLQGVKGPANMLKTTQDTAEGLIQIRRMAYHINKLAGTEVNTGGFATFVQNIKSALAELQSVNGEMVLDVEVKLSPLFGSSVKGVIKNIKDAKKDIEKLKDPIKFTIPINVLFSVSSNAYSAVQRIKADRRAVENAQNGRMTPLAEQNGGAVYRAGGGSIFKPRGTDIVPAMLTPGEFVHNKKAVDYFGMDFMKRVNAMDIRGAMQALMNRGGNVAASLNRQSVINNTVNNNQRVTQNINTNNPSMARMSLGRFAGAI